MAIRYSTRGKLFNLRSLQAIGKAKEERVCDFLFADDCALNASSEDEMQWNMDTFSSACDAFGLTISTKKTEVMFQPAPHTNYSDPTITIMCLSTTRLMQELPKQTQLSEGFVRICGIDKDSNSKQS